MTTKRSKRIKFLSYGLFFYLILALTWWTLLLIVKNNDALNAKIELIKIVAIANNPEITEEAFMDQANVVKLRDDYTKQRNMIIGEAAVFIILLFVGIFQINKSFNREVEAADQQRNFLLSITHELKSPLASIKLILQTFLKRELPKEKKEDLLSSALTESNRLENLVNDLLLSAKLEKAYTPHFEEIPVNMLIEHSVFTLSNSHPSAKINLSMPEEDMVLSTDKEGLYAIIKNLVENGIKYNTNNPEIDIQLTDAPAKQLIISDNGIGISDKDKTKIFKKFYRIGNEDTRKTKGTGLGLYIVKEFVSALGATIEVEDNSPIGTKFIIEF
jgi:two-component system phosphate regulon sensor histidine kinase PhoR